MGVKSVTRSQSGRIRARLALGGRTPARAGFRAGSGTTSGRTRLALLGPSRERLFEGGQLVGPACFGRRCARPPRGVRSSLAGCTRGTVDGLRRPAQIGCLRACSSRPERSNIVAHQGIPYPSRRTAARDLRPRRSTATRPWRKSSASKTCSGSATFCVVHRRTALPDRPAGGLARLHQAHRDERVGNAGARGDGRTGELPRRVEEGALVQGREVPLAEQRLRGGLHGGRRVRTVDQRGDVGGGERALAPPGGTARPAPGAPARRSRRVRGH